jgi:hypothetical protein
MVFCPREKKTRFTPYNQGVKLLIIYRSCKIVIIHQGREDIFLSRGSLIKKRGLKLSSLAWCIQYVPGLSLQEGKKLFNNIFCFI